MATQQIDKIKIHWSIKFRIQVVLMVFVFFGVVLLTLKSSPLYAQDNIQVHPHIAEQAFEVWPNDHNHEMSAFLGKGLRYPEPGHTDDVWKEMCNISKDGGTIVEGAIEEDFYDSWRNICGSIFDLYQSFDHHFFEVDKPDPNGLGLDTDGALVYAKHYWEQAISFYKAGNKPLAYWHLGKVAHLLADVSVPAHTHNDPHTRDSYENYIKDENYKRYIAGNSDSAKINFLVTSLDILFKQLAQRAQYFPSDNQDGNTINPYYSEWPPTNGMRVWEWYWHIHEDNLAKIADYMMPISIQYTAELYKYFWEQVQQFPEAS